MNSMTGNQGMRGPTGRIGNKIPSGYKLGQIQQFDPMQSSLYSSLFPHLGTDSFLSKLAGGDESLFEEMEAPAMRQFSGLQGNLASRFSGMGMGARKSSGFQNTSNQAASDFAQQLQSQRLGLRNQAIRDLMSMSNELLGQRPYEQFLIEKQQKKTGWGGLAGAGIGAVGGFFAGGPAGALTGGKLGYDVGSQF